MYFVRHGLSVMNKQGIFSGRTETPLAPEGLAQAKAAGLELKDVGVDCIVSSPMKRARHTAQIIADEIGYNKDKIILNDLFMERAFGPLEGTPYSKHLQMEDIEGVEPGEELLARAKAGIEFLQTLPYNTIVVTSHGAIGRAMRHLLHPDIPFHGSESFNNAEVIKLL
ncbi:MAG: histidine phosphatase family protein [Candidatus Saccharibacteria bacterium]|nr:histidine phosphatase family protein [Candidatus Saccharibacteria bacterium]